MNGLLRKKNPKDPKFFNPSDISCLPIYSINIQSFPSFISASAIPVCPARCPGGVSRGSAGEGPGDACGTSARPLGAARNLSAPSAERRQNYSSLIELIWHLFTRARNPRASPKLRYLKPDIESGSLHFPFTLYAHVRGV